MVWKIDIRGNVAQLVYGDVYQLPPAASERSLKHTRARHRRHLCICILVAMVLGFSLGRFGPAIQSAINGEVSPPGSCTPSR